MDDKNSALAAKIISHTYVDSGVSSIKSVHKRVRDLLASRSIPQQGWPDSLIDEVIRNFSRMDSNNFLDNVGVGEREGRVACGMVARRHFYLSHGIGRSGDIAAEQPKAAGSSLIVKLANALALDYVRGICGMRNLKSCVIMPLATGMSFSMVLLQLRQTRPAARFAIWQRCDQKSCFKALLTAGLTPIVVEGVINGDEVTTNVEAIEAAVKEHGAENILCIAVTTSTFAPRVPDDVPAVSKIAKAHNVPLVVNNAYGLQSTRCCHLINEACRVGRVDAVVQSTDKNLLVPGKCFAFEIISCCVIVACKSDSLSVFNCVFRRDLGDTNSWRGDCDFSVKEVHRGFREALSRSRIHVPDPGRLHYFTLARTRRLERNPSAPQRNLSLLARQTRGACSETRRAAAQNEAQYDIDSHHC